MIGDYLVVGLEMSADSGGSPNANPSYIKIYDISALRLNPLSPSNPDVTLIEVGLFIVDLQIVWLFFNF